jgi:hypothetical protein
LGKGLKLAAVPRYCYLVTRDGDAAEVAIWLYIAKGIDVAIGLSWRIENSGEFFRSDHSL